MRTCIALLRGINVGSGARIPMAELRALCASLGWQDVQTYNQSGNVVFRAAAKPAALEQQLEDALPAAFGVSAAVIVRSAMATIVATEFGPAAVAWRAVRRVPCDVAPVAIFGAPLVATRGTMPGAAMLSFRPDLLAATEPTVVAEPMSYKVGLTAGTLRNARWRLVFVAVIAPAACAGGPRLDEASRDATVAGAARATSQCADSAAAFRRVVAEFQARQQNAAISVGVRHNGVDVFHEATGYADRERAVAADAGMAFSIASITKAFTGVALLKLAEQGRIDLDAEIQRYVPAFPRHPSGRPVTVRMLAHNLGAVRHWGAERGERLYARRFDDVTEILELFRDDPWVPDLAPLTRASYSSYGYNLLGMAIRNASGRPYPEYLSAAILRPLGLTSVHVDRPGLGGERRPARYSWYDLKEFHELEDAPQRVPDWDYSHNLAGGGLIANVGDLLTFGRALREPGLLSAESLALVWTRPVVDGVESSMSFGWFPRVDGPRRISINGSNAGVQATLTVWRDEDLVVAALANSWGRGSRSGEFMDDGTDGFVGRLAAVCVVQ